MWQSEARSTKDKVDYKSLRHIQNIFNMGAMAQMAYQAKAIGATRSEIKLARSAAVEASRGGRNGKCTTTKLELAYGRGNGPAIRIRREQAKEFLKL